jgi:hypothetical protein
MPKVAIIIGILLDTLGIVTYAGAAAGIFGTGHASPTALIPSVVGTLLLGCGILAANPAYLKHAMHAAAAIALLGFIGAIMRPIMTMARGTFALNAASVSQFIMAALCALFVILAIRSFKQIRRERLARGSSV